MTRVQILCDLKTHDLVTCELYSSPCRRVTWYVLVQSKGRFSCRVTHAKKSSTLKDIRAISFPRIAFLTCHSSVDGNRSPLSLAESIYGIHSNFVLCSLLQIFKTCSSMWDGQIFWLYCLPFPLEFYLVAGHGTSAILAWRFPRNVNPVTGWKHLYVVRRLRWTWNDDDSEITVKLLRQGILKGLHPIAARV